MARVGAQVASLPVYSFEGPAYLRLYKPVPLRLYIIGGGVAQRRRGPIDLSTSGR